MKGIILFLSFHAKGAHVYVVQSGLFGPSLLSAASMWQSGEAGGGRRSLLSILLSQHQSDSRRLLRLLYAI